MTKYIIYIDLCLTVKYFQRNSVDKTKKQAEK